MATTSFWQDAPSRPRPPFAGDASVDVLVVGGGMTGTSAAFHAASHGARTLLLEAGRVAGGASGRNMGFLMAAPEAYYADSIGLYGRDLARDVWRLNRANARGVEALARKLGLDCDLERTGSVVAAVRPDEAGRLHESARLLREDGFPAEVLDARETRDATRGEGFLAGLLTRDDATLHPVKFVRGLADAAEAAGAGVHEGSRVVGLERRDGGWAARVEGGGTVLARSVICGLNAYAPGLLAFAETRVFPVRGQVMALPPVEGPRPPCPVYADDGYLYARSYGGRVLAGGMRYVARGDEVGSVDAANPVVQSAVERELRARWPATAGAAPTHRWSGMMGFSRDGLPWIGEVPGSPGLLTFFGCTGHGWGYGVWAGATLARAAATGGQVAEVPSWCAMDRPLVPERLVD